MIKPTVGRVVWYHPAFVEGNGPNEITLAAIIAWVHADDLVNLCVIREDGQTIGATHVHLYQGESVHPAHEYAEWMPYQIGQARPQQQEMARTAAIEHEKPSEPVIEIPVVVAEPVNESVVEVQPEAPIVESEGSTEATTQE